MTSTTPIDELLDAAVRAINDGDRAAADALAGQILAVDQSNAEAEELLLSSPVDGGEIRRLTILFADLVDSTALSTRVELEVYRTVVGSYRDEVLRIVSKYEGHIASTKGDGLLAVFGHPTAHENDAHRAVQAGLDITGQVAALSRRVQQRFGFDIEVRIGVHRGLVYLDVKQDDVYGLGANLAARMCSLAEPGTVAVSAAIERVVRDDYHLSEQPAQSVKGVEGPQVHYTVLGERDSTAISAGPLVGRLAELARLHDIWEQKLSGDSTIPGVLLHGEAGIGKSRLAGAVVEMARQSGATVLGMFGSPFHTHVGLRPIRRMLEMQSGITRGSDPAESIDMLGAELVRRGLDLETGLPLLAPILGLRPGSDYQPAKTSAGRLYIRIVDAAIHYLLACVGDGLGLILIEDLQWFDEDTLEVVEALLRERSSKTLVLITDRRAPAVVGAIEAFELKPLLDNDADELISALHPDLTAKERKSVRSRCDGIPLYIEEVIAKIKDSPSDASRQGQVPDTLYESLIARVRSSKWPPSVVEAAALIGSRIDSRLLASVVEMEQPKVDEILNDLTRARVLRRLQTGSWHFHHELVREAAAELAPPSIRRKLHGRIADALVAAASDGAPEWPLVAHHYESAEWFGAAARSYQKASANARQRGALIEARNHLSRALENIDRLPAGKEREHSEVEVRLERGFLASAAAGHASSEAAAEFERCLQLIGDRPSPELYATLSALWSYYATRGDLDRATQLVQALQSRLTEMPEWYRAATEAVTGSLHVFRGEFDSARTTLESAAIAVAELESAEIEGAWYAPNDPVAGMHTFVGFVRYIQGDLAGASEAFVQMERRCDALPFPHGPFTRCYGKTLEALVRTEAGQHGRAMQLVGEVAAMGNEYGFDEWVMISASEGANAVAKGSIATGQSDPGAMDAHIQTLTAVVEGWRAADLKSFLSWYDAALALALLAADRKSDARARIELALAMSDETGWHIYDAELVRIRARTHEAQSERAADLHLALQIARDQGALVFELRSAADLFKADRVAGRDPLLDVLSKFPVDQDWPELADARSLLA